MGWHWYRYFAGMCSRVCTVSRGFNLLFYAAAIVLTALLGWFMVSIAIRRPVKIAASISPIEAVRFTGNQSGKAHTHKKNMRLNPSPWELQISGVTAKRRSVSWLPESGRGDPLVTASILWFVRRSGSQDSISRMGIIKSISILKKQNMR